MNVIANNPSLIRRAHITGVSAERDPMAKIILASWKDLLNERSLKAFAWSIILSTYSERFLAMNGPEKISFWVDHIISNNLQIGLSKLIEQTGESDPLELANQIKQSQTRIQLAVGGDDKVSNIEQVERLNSLLGLRDVVLVYKSCGHAVLNERPDRWRKQALEFLSRSD